MTEAALGEQQQALLRALWQPRHQEAIDSLAGGAALAQGEQWRRGLLAYRSNASELAQRALAGAYPVVAQLLGEDNFGALARQLWLAYPPHRGDVAQWGRALAAHIESVPGLRDEEPYLGDVARVEWLLHVAATAADAAVDMASLQLLATHDPASLGLVLSEGAACVVSRYPVASIIGAHLDGEPALEEAGRRLRAGMAETALVWRAGLKPSVRSAAPGEAPFVAALQEMRSLADSLAAAPDLDFSQWLAPAVQSGLLVAARAL